MDSQSGTQFTALLPWERQQDEPDLWFLHFTAYVGMGPKRTLRMTYARQRSPKAPLDVPASWFEAFQTWGWRARAAAYDDEQKRVWRLKRDEFEQKARDERTLVLKAARGKLIEAMQRTDAADPAYERIVADLIAVNAELRRESEDG